MGLLDTPGYSRAASDARFASFDKARAAALLAKIGGLREPIPAVTADVPTVTHATSAAITVGPYISAQSSILTKLGSPGSWNATFGRLSVGDTHALAFYTNSDDFEIQWFNGTNPNYPWVWVDGQPVTAGPVSTVLTASGSYNTRIQFGSVKRRRIEFWTQGNDAWVGIRAAAWTSLFEPLSVRPAVCFIGDSFFGGSDTTFCPVQLTASAIMGRALNVDFHTRGVSGTGYVAGANTFGSAGRVSALPAIPDLELIVVSGSVNDDSSGTVGTAAAAAYAAYATAAPGVPVIVFGPQPSSDTATIHANRQTNIAQVKAAALAAPNVIGFVDMVGSAAATPPAFSGGSTYNTGDLVTYQGSVWEAVNGANTIPGSNVPGASHRWRLVTYLYTGTGNTGATASNGTRDGVLYSDDIHPTQYGSYALGLRQASDIMRILGEYATTE